MKRFIIRISTITFITIAVLVVLDVCVSALLHKSTEQRYIVWNELRKGNINADVLIMGNSRAFVQYSPQIIDSILSVSSYNLGIQGRTFDAQIIRYNIYKLYHNQHPKIILQNIDYTTTLSRVIGYENEQFFPYFYDKEFMAEVKKTEPFSWLEYHVPFYRYCRGFKILRVLKCTLLEKDKLLKKGFYAHDSKWNPKHINELDSIQFEYEPLVKDLFCDYIEELQADSIQLVLVCAPYHISATSKVVNLDEYYAMLDSITDTYNVPFLDYTYCNIAYDTTNFYNASHLNKKGAELFSTMLANDLDSLGIIH